MCEHTFVPPRSYTETEAREAIAASETLTEALRRLGVCHTGGARTVLKKWVEIWQIPTEHFDPDGARERALSRARREPRPLAELLVPHSLANRGRLKERLYAEGLKERRCELCGQDEVWNGRRMSLILDQVNGVRDDNRLENLRIVCPNCNATLDTHCGRSLRREPRSCLRCHTSFEPKHTTQRYCSRACGSRHERRDHPRFAARRAARPPLDQLLAEVAELGWVGTGRKYGVSDNAIRKWVRAYEEAAAQAGGT